jgi:hypothetical protein
MSGPGMLRTYVVVAWDKREQKAVELRMREANAKDAATAARKAGWRDGILAVKRIADLP